MKLRLYIYIFYLHPQLIPETDCKQRTGKTHTHHMMACLLHCTWAVNQLFWVIHLYYRADWLNTQKVSVALPLLKSNLAWWILAWLSVRSTRTSSNVSTQRIVHKNISKNRTNVCSRMGFLLNGKSDPQWLSILPKQLRFTKVYIILRLKVHKSSVQGPHPV